MYLAKGAKARGTYLVSLGAIEQTVVVDDSAGVFGNTFPRTVIVDPQGIVRYERSSR